MIEIGKRVQIGEKSRPCEKDRYQGRSGTVVRLNGCSVPEQDGGLWYVEIDATDKYEAAIDTFWGSQLQPNEHHQARQVRAF